MTEKLSAAFLSYVHSDDNHDGGRISRLRERLEGEIRMQTGQPFRIFQDRNDLEWGQNWSERIDKSLNEVTFLIPIITPSFFRSPACRKEFDIFHQREKSLGTTRLILPIYYLNCDEIEYSNNDLIADVLKTRHWADWRPLRFFDIHGPDVSNQLADQAVMIKRAVKELDSIFSENSSIELDNLITKSKFIDSDAELKVDNSTPAEEITISNPATSTRRARRKNTFEYNIFTKEFDEVIRSSDLLSAAESVELGRKAINLAEKISNQYSKYILSYEQKLEIYDDISISILVDNSGSLRGEKISATAAWSIVLLELFDRLGWNTELTGFTTISWKGGQSREKWLRAGRPPSPGRLADLRYIIYKDFEESLVGSAQSLGTMLKEAILKENIDGEAIEWAAARIAPIKSVKKIILVMSDGAPVDDSTLSVNPEKYLENHLRQVLSKLENTDISVFAVGIEHNVTRYYGKHGVTATKDDLGLKALKIIENKLSQDLGSI